MSPRMGRPAIFAPKDGGQVSAKISHAGRVALERCRRHLHATARRLGLKLTSVSDGDVIESLARGENVTAKEIADRLKEQSDAS